MKSTGSPAAKSHMSKLLRQFLLHDPKETLNKSFLPFFTTLSVTYFRALLKATKRMLRIIQLFPKETLNKSFLPFFTTLSVTYFRALLKTAKRMLRIIQLFPKETLNKSFLPFFSFFLIDQIPGYRIKVKNGTHFLFSSADIRIRIFSPFGTIRKLYALSCN